MRFGKCRLPRNRRTTRRTTLQRLFSAFPRGSPGLGLVLLRGFVALTFIAEGVAYIESRELSVLSLLVAALVFLTAVCLLIGFLTPIAAVVTAISATALAASGLFFPAGSLVGLTVLAAAIALLGPGAFSLDSRLFGRREILIPNTNREHFRDS